MTDARKKPATRAKADGVSRPEEDPIAPMVQALLREIGEDPTRDGLEQTPSRVAKAFRFFTQGYQQNPREVLSEALFDVSYDEMVLVKDIEFYSLCEHHMLPFFGRCHIGYIPNGKVIGVSKLARLTDVFARRLQIQERLTNEIAETIQETIGADGDLSSAAREFASLQEYMESLILTLSEFAAAGENWRPPAANPRGAIPSDLSSQDRRGP